MRILIRFFWIILFFPITKYLCVQYCVALLLIMHELWCDLILPCVFPIFPYASRSSIIFLSLSVDLEYYLSGKPSNKSLWSALLKKNIIRCRYVDTFFFFPFLGTIRVWVQYFVLTSCLSVSLFFLLSSAILPSFYTFFLY
jgi:hypothetical protein